MEVIYDEVDNGYVCIFANPLQDYACLLLDRIPHNMRGELKIHLRAKIDRDDVGLPRFSMALAIMTYLLSENISFSRLGGG